MVSDSRPKRYYTVPPIFDNGAPPATSPAPSTNFAGLPDNNAFWPPDTHGAVGTNRMMTMFNTQVRVQDRSGTVLFTDTLANWWSPAGNVNFPFDPRVLYDPYRDRWIAVALCNRRSADASLLVAASQSGNPTGTWYRVRVDVDTANATWADYPSVGFNKDWVAITLKLVNNTNDALVNSRVYVLNKTNLYAGTVSASAVNFGSADGFDQVPASTYDTNQARLYLVQDFNRAFTDTNGVTRGYLALWDISGSVTSPTVSFRAFMGADPWGAPPSLNFAPQSGLAVGLNVGADSRIQNVVFRNGRIWCAHTVCLALELPDEERGGVVGSPDECRGVTARGD